MKYFNKPLIVSAFITLMVVSTLVFVGYSEGITRKTLMNGEGCNCHGPASAQVVVQISGKNVVEVGSTNKYNVRITGGPLAAAGINIATNFGSVSNFINDLQVIDGELTHVSPKTPISSAVNFEFNYTAPANPGNAILYATANSVNLNGGTSGDQWAHANNFPIQIVPLTNVDDKNILSDYNLYQNYPNPFNPNTKIDYYIPKSSKTNLTIYDVNGNKIETLIDKYQQTGKYTIDFNGKDYASGIYYYKLSTEDYVSIKKMLLIK